MSTAFKSWRGTTEPSLTSSTEFHLKTWDSPSKSLGASWKEPPHSALSRRPLDSGLAKSTKSNHHASSRDDLQVVSIQKELRVSQGSQESNMSPMESTKLVKKYEPHLNDLHQIAWKERKRAGRVINFLAFMSTVHVIIRTYKTIGR